MPASVPHPSHRFSLGLILVLLALFGLSDPARCARGTGAASANAGSTGATAFRTEIPASPDSARDAAITRFARDLAADVRADDVGGITAAVFQGERMIWARGFGWADRNREIPAAVGTVYRTGSISKSVTALVLARLADRGVVSLDDPVERYLPEIRALKDRPVGTDPITLRQLASHTAGLIREPELEGAASGPIVLWEQRVLASIPTTRFQDLPGERYSYSNIGFGILGLTLSRAANRPFMDLVRELVFEPLEMTSSTFILDAELESRLATGYVNRRDGTIDAEHPAQEHEGRGYKVPNGGVYSTVHDMGRFMALMTGALGHEILSLEVREEMLTVQTPEEEDGGYGLGFSIATDSLGHRVMGHGGSVAGYNAYILFHPATDLGVVLFRNYNRGETSLGGAARALLAELIRVS